MNNYTPVIIIGAGRSGTNMLRDIITSIEGFETWDCDEINPIWRYGNRNYPTDEIPIENLTPRIKKYIRARFDKLQKQSNAKFVVEKTCANSLRLAYVHAIFPEAKFVIINRDGRDVVPSAMKRWVSSFELKYTLKKLRYVPSIDLWYYVSKFGFNRVKQLFSKTESLSFWGPLYEGIEDDVRHEPLLNTCAKQWKNCAERTMDHRMNVPSENIFDVRYEEFVNNPIAEMNRFLDFFGIELSGAEIDTLVSRVSNRSVGNYKKNFNAEELNILESITKDTLKKLNYNID